MSKHAGRSTTRGALALAGVMLVASALAGAGAGVAPTPSLEAFMEKADAPLVVAAREGATELEAIVVGAPHARLPVFASRADAVAWVDASAAAFIDGVRADVERSGGRVVGAWSAAPAVKIVAPLHTLALVAARGDVVSMGADAPGAVRLFAPEDAEQGMDAQNTGGRRMIQAEEAWSLGYRGEGVTIAMIGTGVDATHEAFRAADGSSRITHWRDFISNQPTPYDDHGFGTFTAAAAVGSDVYDDPNWGRFQEAGVAPGANIMVVKFLDSGGGGTFADALNAIDFAFTNGADVTTNAWGATCSSSSNAVLAAVRTTTDAGLVHVFTAGASGPNAGTVAAPACSESAISVGGVTQSLDIYSPSGRGPCSDPETGGPSRVCPDLVAKASPIRSAAPRGVCSFCDSTGYRTAHSIGTAASYVAGAVGVIEQMKRSITGEGWDTPARAERAVLMNTALDLGPPGVDNTFGAGLPQILNVHALLDGTAGANVVHTFNSASGSLRQGGSATLHFGVRNIGGAEASGTFEASLTHPDGTVETLASRAISLGTFESDRVDRTFVVSGATQSGVHTFRGSFLYSWVNETTGDVEHGSVVREADFEVRRVRVSLDVDGIEPTAAPGQPQNVRVTLTNEGNERAERVLLRFTASDDYVFANTEGFDPSSANTRYASPAPDKVQEDANFGRLTLEFDVGTLEQGDSFSFGTTIIPTTPGTNRFLVTVLYCDTVGNCASFGELHTQVVGLPL